MRKKVQRVICFDLFGTLLQQQTQVLTKERYISDFGWDVERIEAEIRGALMTETSSYRFLGAMAEDRMPNYRELYSLLYERLYIPPTDFIHYFDSVPDPQQVIALWKKENQELEITQEAEAVIARFKNDSANTLALLTNLTPVGREATWELCQSLKFDYQYVSCMNPVAKPDPYVWQSVVLEFEADEYWMIGDDPVIDLAVPAAMGWKTILVGKNGVELNQAPGIIYGRKK